MLTLKTPVPLPADPEAVNTVTANPPALAGRSQRVSSIDLLRGTVMIIMALDHTRDYFSRSAFLFDPADLSHTSVPLFFTRWITHFCAPVFVFLAGCSAYLYGFKRTRRQLSFFLFTRGLWLALAECCIVTLEQTFNPSYPFFNLQVIWAIGFSMIALSVIVRMNMRLILLTGVLLIAGHNLLDTVHVPGSGLPSFFWSLLHDPGNFRLGRLVFYVRYPVLPWIGIMAAGYCFGRFYKPGADAGIRKGILLILGCTAISLFSILRAGNFYGDAACWSQQKNAIFSLMSFLNVTKYPPSLLYCLVTLGPALIFLAFAERSTASQTQVRQPAAGQPSASQPPAGHSSAGRIRDSWREKITIFGRVPMFYYLVHFFLIHFLAVFAAMLSGDKWTDMILSTRINSSPQLKAGYGFGLLTVYGVWAAVIVLLYPLCRWFDRYKRAHQATQRWLSYL